MKIILKKEVANLGEAGDVLEVKGGYGLNYLIPQGFAIAATPSALKQLEETKRQRAHKEAKLVADAEALAARIEAVPVKVAVKVSESGKIYGSVSNIQIAEALEAKGVKIERKTIDVDAIKTLGQYTVVARLHREVSAEIVVNVVAE